MSFDNLTRLLFTVSLCFGALACAGNSMAQGQVAADLEKRGRAALEAENFQAAAELFSEASAQATDRETRARLNFRQAVTLQQMASKSELDNPQIQLKQAARLYQAYLKVHPESTAASNNLARVLEQMGDNARNDSDEERASRYYAMAARSYQKAISAGDARQGFYLKNYSELLDKSGKWPETKEVYAQLVKDHPVSRSLAQSMARAYSRNEPGELPELGWNLLDAGYLRLAVDMSLDAIRNSRDVADKSREELLSVVCAGLAQGSDDYRQFLESEAGRQVLGLTVDDFLGQGATEIVDLYQGRDFDRSSYQWWAQRGSPRGDPDRGLWPVDSFRALIRSLGSRAKRSGEPGLADRYFRLAANLREWETDPVAVRALVQMYAEQNAYERIDQVLQDYQVQLFQGKGNAYRESSVEKIFQYHQTLGELYALIERWGDSSRVDSAIFQLEHAREKSIMLEENTSRTLPEKYQFTPHMVDALSSAYVKTGQNTRATELRIDQAERYQKSGNIKAKQRVLTPVKETEVPPTLQTRYQKLRVNPEALAPARNLDLQRATIKTDKDSGG